MKTVYLIHGWGDNQNSNWFPWIKKELEKKNFKVIIPNMPNTDKPKIEEWVSHLKKVIKGTNENTYFIGHSLGCQAILRYLELTNKKVGGAIFVAGWFNLKNLEDEELLVAKPWIETPINFDKIKKNLKLTVFLSENDPFNCLKENKTMFETKLGAKVKIIEKAGHFVIGDGANELLIVLNELLNM